MIYNFSDYVYMRLICLELTSLNLEFGDRHIIMYFGIQNSFEASNNMRSGDVLYYLDCISYCNQ